MECVNAPDLYRRRRACLYFKCTTHWNTNLLVQWVASAVYAERLTNDKRILPTRNVCFQQQIYCQRETILTDDKFCNQQETYTNQRYPCSAGGNLIMSARNYTARPEKHTTGDKLPSEKLYCPARNCTQLETILTNEKQRETNGLQPWWGEIGGAYAKLSQTPLEMQWKCI